MYLLMLLFELVLVTAPLLHKLFGKHGGLGRLSQVRSYIVVHLTSTTWFLIDILICGHVTYKLLKVHGLVSNI